jgi:inhibitor of KinA
LFIFNNLIAQDQLLKLSYIFSNQYSISPLNETALLVSFDNVIDETINEKVLDLYEAFAAHYFPGFIEAVPAYCSLAVFYDVATIRNLHPDRPLAFDFVKEFTIALISGLGEAVAGSVKNSITIPVCYNGDDLHYVAGEHHITTEEVIAIHTQKNYRVFMIGFQPGFAYMGKLDERIATPRKASPRTQVPAGSVGIAGFQTGIYPLSTPGGWQLIGQTPLKIFDKTKANPCLLKAGDIVEFKAINADEFKKLNEY